MNINEEKFTRELNCWAQLRIPARVDAVQASKLLGVAPHDIPILVSVRLLIPLGKPVQNSTKWFCACELIALAADREWLHKATIALSRYWLTKRERRSTHSSRNQDSEMGEAQLK